jgi:hypothetical protein
MNISIENLLKQKNNAENKNLDSEKLNYIINIFSTQSYRDNKFTYNNKYHKNKKQQDQQSYKNNNILKNKTLQNKKETVVNKINLILNKLSENNIDALINEFNDNIGNVDELNWQSCQKTFYLKMLSENKFMKVYIIFFKIISIIYNYDISYFISLLETKFKSDYIFDFTYNENDYSFLQNLSDEKRNNNLHLIYNLIDMNILNNNLFSYCDNIIINQILFTEDIYNWFILRNIKLSEKNINIIKKHINDSILPRNKILLLNLIDLNKTKPDNLLQNDNIEKNDIEKNDIIENNDIENNDIENNDIENNDIENNDNEKNDIIEEDINNILDIYLKETENKKILLLLSKIDFTDSENITKIILKYMNALETDSNKLLDLYKELIKKNILNVNLIINTRNVLFKTRNVKLINRIKKFNAIL